MNNLLLYFRGRVALAEILIASGIVAGDKVAIQAYTCSAVPEGIFASKAKPLYIDVVKEGVTMSPIDLALKLNNTKNVKAIVIQHTFGIVADVEKIIKIAKKHNLIIIEDCCHTYNSEYKGYNVGSFSDASFYSFEWGKPIPLGLGGAAKVINLRILDRLKQKYSMLDRPPFFTEIQLFIQRIAYFTLYNVKTYWTVKKLYHFFLKIRLIKGNHSHFKINQMSKDFNYKISRILEHQLEKKFNTLSTLEKKNQKTISIIEKNLHNIVGVKKIKTLPETKQIYVRYPIWVSDKKKILYLAQVNKVEIAAWYTSVVHPYLDKELSSVGYSLGSCPNAERSSKHIVSLPISNKNKYIEQIFNVLKKVGEVQI
jgi:dTDP-4-amino-4,6-dideoxygalactose transaminase